MTVFNSVLGSAWAANGGCCYASVLLEIASIELYKELFDVEYMSTNEVGLALACSQQVMQPVLDGL